MCLVSVAGIVRGVSAPTAHRRFTEWFEAEVFARLHQAVLDLLGSAGAIDWSRSASVDGVHVRAVNEGPDRPQPG